VLALCCLTASFAKVIPPPKYLPVVARSTWESNNEPSLLVDDGYEKNFAKLPVGATLDVTPWSDTYWPSYKGGIATRWSTSDDSFKYKLHSLAELKQMSDDDLKALSPAEKFDIYRAEYNYPLVAEERKRTDPKCASWEGICHGWSPASLNYAEPGPVTVVNPDGINVPFAASDIKGLLDFYQGQVARGSTKFVANRCNYDKNSDSQHMDDPECRDINAGAFHLAITNSIGLQKLGFVADVTRDLQVWNQPVFKYATSETRRTNGASDGAAPDTQVEVEVSTDMTYGVEVAQQWGPTGTTSRTVNYKYRLELNGAGEIVGGEWLQSQWDRPDFLWTQAKVDFQGDWAALATVYGAATGSTAVVPASQVSSATSSTQIVLISVAATLGCVLVVLSIVYAVVARRTPAPEETSRNYLSL